MIQCQRTIAISDLAKLRRLVSPHGISMAGQRGRSGEQSQGDEGGAGHFVESILIAVKVPAGIPHMNVDVAPDEYA